MEGILSVIGSGIQFVQAVPYTEVAALYRILSYVTIQKE
jgi:hypothetical protein